jgi:hypothetical protein
MKNEIQLIISAKNETDKAVQQTITSFSGLGTKVAAICVGISASYYAVTQVINAVSDVVKGVTTGVAEQGEEFLKVSKMIGVSVENVSGLSYAAKLSETSLEALTTGLGFLSKSLYGMNEEGQDTTELLKALGVTSKDPYEAFLQISDAMRGMESAADRTVITMKLFGRGSKDLIPLMLEGSEGIKKMQEEALRLGVTFDEKSAKAADDFGDNLIKLKENANGLAVTIGNVLIPALNKLFNAFGEKGQLLDEIGLLERQIWLREQIAKIRIADDGSYQKSTEEMKKVLAELDKKLLTGNKPPPATEAAKIREQEAKEKAEKATKKAAEEARKQREEQEKNMPVSEFDKNVMDYQRVQETKAKEEAYKKAIQMGDEYEAEEEARLGRLAEAQKESHITALEQIKEFSEDYHLFRVKQLDEYAEKMRREGIAEVDIERWKSEEMKKLSREEWQFRLEHAGNAGDAIRAKLSLMAMDTKTVFEDMANVVESVFRGLESGLSSFFFDAMQGKLKSLQDYVSMFLAAIQQKIANILAAKVVSSIIGLAGGADTSADWALNIPSKHAGGLVMHAGGFVPRFHFGGLASDEVPAILQRGEYVVSKRGVETLDRINQGNARGSQGGNTTIIINAVDAASFGDLCRRNPGAILGPVMEHRKRGGNL